MFTMTDSKMTESDRLNQAQNEIETILQRHSLGGCIILCSPNSEQMNLKLPEWSAIQIRNGSGLNIENRLYIPSMPKLVSETARMLFVLKEVTSSVNHLSNVCLNFMEKEKLISSRPWTQSDAFKISETVSL